MSFFLARFTRRSIVVMLTIVLVVLAAFIGTPLASHAAQHASTSPHTTKSVPAANSLLPTFINPAADLGRQDPGSATSFTDSIYIAGLVHSATHRFGIIVHTYAMPGSTQLTFYFSVVDETAGTYQSATILQSSTSHWDKGAPLNLQMPGLTWTGDTQRMSVSASTSWGKLAMVFVAHGPVLNYAGTGYFPLFGAGSPNYEYAFPSMSTTGTLTFGGKSYNVSGESWLDRQWGTVNLTPTARWSWMDMNLSNGDKVAIWDTVAGTTENSWATVMHPDGSYELAAVTPLAVNASRFWTSPTSHLVYPTRWLITIPSLHAALRVAITGPLGQEFKVGPHYEGTASIIGTYQGHRVTGQTYVEMVGNWS